MNFSGKLIFATGLLYLDRRVSFRRLRRELELDDDEFEELHYELVKVKRIARDEGDGLLVWAGNEAAPVSPIGVDKVEAVPDMTMERRTTEPGRESRRHASAGEAERRQLTVMFCDIVGSTGLAARTDPEDLGEIITRFQDACRVVIKRYDGFIARYMGDGILVYFGYPQAHEDDVARAVRCALDVTHAMTRLNPGLLDDYGVELSVRIGVATGSVVVGNLIGEGAAEEAAVVGETPNLAARLQGLAGSNEVVVDNNVHRLIGAQFEWQDLGRHNLKGLEQPVQAWRAVLERDADSMIETRRTAAGSTLIGRQEELGLLLRSWEAAKVGHGQVVSISGEAGVGKSRLIEALRNQLGDEEFLSVTMRCSPYHTHSSLHPVIGHLQKVLKWRPEDSNDDRLAKLETVLAQRDEPLVETVPLIADLLALSLPPNRYAPLTLNPKQRRERTLDTLAGWLFEEAEKRPVLQVWEDLHWADPTTLELLGLYIDQTPTVAMLNVLTYRPEFVPPWPTRSHVTPITLNRMERSEIENLIALRTGGKALPAEVIRHVVDKSDGVPLYVEELTKTILESEFLREEGGRYVLTRALADVSVPTTLQDSLMARLDRVPMAREVAQLGAVLGREFAYEMLSSLSTLEEPELKQGLDQLVGNELLYQRGRPPRARFIFKHALIHDAAYQSLLKRTRQQYHREVAKLLQARFHDAVQTNPEILAHHYTEAGDFQKGVEYWLKAGERAREQSANLEALGHFERGLEVLGRMPQSNERNRLELAMQIAVGGANIVTRGHAANEVEKAYGRAAELCRELGDVPENLASVFGLWRFFIVCRHNEASLDLARQLLALANDSGDPVRYVMAHYATGFTELVMGRLEAARENMNRAMSRYDPVQRSAEIYRSAHDPGTACLAYLSNCEWLMGYPDQAARTLERSLELAESIQDAVSLAHALCFASITSEMLGNDERTQVIADRAVVVSLDRGFAAWIAVGNLTRTWIAVKQQRPDASSAQLADEIEAFGALGYDILLPYFLTLLTRAYLAEGVPEKGLEALKQAETIATSRDEFWWLPEVHRLRGEIMMDLPGAGYEQARDWFEKALQLGHDQAALSLELRAATSLAGVWLKQDDAARAGEIVRSVLDRFTEGFATPDLRRAATVLASCNR